MSKNRRIKIIRSAIRKTYKRELSQYWELPFLTRLKLGWAIVLGKKG